MPGKDCQYMDLLVTVENITVSPSPTARDLGVVLDNQLCCTANITAVTRSYRFAIYHIRRIWPFLTREAAQLLVQSLVISTTATRSWLDSLPLRLNLCSATARLVYNLPKFSHVTPLFRALHWFPVVARIRFKMMVLAYKLVNGTAPATSKHWSSHTPQLDPSAQLPQLDVWYRHR